MNLRLVLGGIAASGVLTIYQAVAVAQPRPAAPPADAAQTGMQAALIDLTGHWVSVVDEDWRFRMMTPPKGDYAQVPLNPTARGIADEFNPALYGGARYQLSGIIDCRAYGAAGLMHMPMRLQISWASANELRIQTDWGEQTRLLHFMPGHPYEDMQQPLMTGESATTDRPAASTQGYSVAVWEQPYHGGALAYQRGPVGGFNLYRSQLHVAQPGGNLAVVTTHLEPGWLRRNGVPYGAHTRLLEHYMSFQDPTGARWFDVVTEVIDPEYLTAPFNTTSDFQQEPDGSKWMPHPCRQLPAEVHGDSQGQ